MCSKDSVDYCLILRDSKQMEIYSLAIGTFDYDMVVQDRNTWVPGKLQVQFISNFQISMSLLSIY